MLNSAIIIDFENHRSRARIKDMGEVFTPEKYVQQLIDTLDSKVWSDESVIFFEPTCGHGNIVVPLFIRRYQELKRKYEKADASKPALHAIANALNTLWAIDICASNVELTRKRLFEFIIHTLNQEKYYLHQARTREFVGHVLCALVKQVHENEALSSIGRETSAHQTRVGRDWVKANGHDPINFQDTWCNYFLAAEKGKVIPIEFKNAISFIESSMSGKGGRTSKDFSFAKEFIQNTHAVKPALRAVEGVA